VSVASSCSWCHTMNTLVPGVRNLCRHCGHRADLCRLDCDCPQCAGLFSPPRVPLTPEDVDAMLNLLDRDRKGGES
jgi:hypothetical protein